MVDFTVHAEPIESSELMATAANNGECCFCFKCRLPIQGDTKSIKADVRMQDVDLQIVVSMFWLFNCHRVGIPEIPKHLIGTGLTGSCLGSNGKAQHRANSHA